MVLRNAVTTSSSVTSGQTASNLPNACGAEAVPPQGVPGEGEYFFHVNMLQLPVGEGEKHHYSNYRGCRHAKEKIQKNESQRTPRTTTGRVFSSNLTTPGVSFAAALRVRTEEQQQTQIQKVAGPATLEPRVPAPLPQHEQQKTGHSVQASGQNVESSSNGSTTDYARV
jgi:hypothetical protein